MSIQTKNRLAGAIQLAFQGAANPTVGFSFSFNIAPGVYEVQLLIDQ